MTVPNRRTQVLRERPDAFRAAIGFLLEGYDAKADFLRATRSILWVMDRWQSFSEMELEAPRRAEIARLLRQTERDSRKLMASLRPLSRHLDGYMHIFLPPRLLDSDPAFDFYGRADIHVIHNLPNFNRSGLYSRLIALRDFCRISLIQESKESDGSSWLGADSGGGANVFKEHYGSAKWQLVYESTMAYSNFQPDRLTTTTDGPLYGFCAAIYELATGNEAEERGVGLIRYVQFAAPKIRALVVKGQESRALQFPNPSKPLDPLPLDVSRDLQIRVLESEIRKLHRVLQHGPKKLPRQKVSPVNPVLTT